MGRNGDPDKPVEPEKAREHGNNLGAVRVRGGEPEAGTETDGQSMNPKVTNVRTSDRVANPWSERTPSGQDEDWPIRVDQFLVDVISEDDVDCWVQTASILHSNGDVLDMAVKDGRIAGVRGRAVDRVNKGRVGPKDLFGWQANNSEDRLTRPLVRKNGELVETSWDEAMDVMVECSRRLLEEKGAAGFRLLHHGPALSRGVLHLGRDRERTRAPKTN